VRAVLAMIAVVDSPWTAAAKRLLDGLRAQGFAFERIGPGEDAPVRGVRDSIAYRDEIYLGGFSDSCFAQRRTRRSIIVPGGLPVTSQVEGDALTVLHVVATEWNLTL